MTNLCLTKCKDTQALFEGERVKRWMNIERPALRKLAQLDWSAVLEDLKVPPGNGLEALKDDRKGLHSIRINQQWRVCFVWTPKGTGYHPKVFTIGGVKGAV